MKSIYKILIIGVVCLLSTKNFAQFEVTSDPTNRQIQGKSGSIAGCICGEGIAGDYIRFSNILAQLAAKKKDEWLAKQQKIQKNEIERRLRKSFPSFPEAQKEYFKKISYKQISDQFLDEVIKEYNKSSPQNIAKVAQKRIEINTLQYRGQVSDALAAYTFGDLKSGGKLIKDYFSVTGRINEIASELNNSLKPVANDASRIKNGLIKVRDRDLLLNRIVELAIARFNSYSVEDKVKVMTKYLIQPRTLIEGIAQLGVAPPFIYDAGEHNPRQIAIDQARNIGTPDALPNPSETGNEVINLHAIASISDQAFAYVNTRTSLKEELGKYFNHNRYNAQSVAMMQRVMNPYLSNNNLSAFSSELTSNMVPPTLQSGSNRELALSWRADGLLEGINHPFDGVGNVMAELYTNEERTFPREGNSIRQMFNANGLSVPSTISDYDLGRVFDFNKTPYGGKPGPNFYYNVEIIFKPTIGRILWSQGVRMDNIYSDPINMQAAVAASRGESFDIQFFKAISNVSDRLNLNSTQRNWLGQIENRDTAIELDTFINKSLEGNSLPTEALEIGLELFNYINGVNTTPLGIQFFHDALFAYNNSRNLDFSPYLNQNLLIIGYGATVNCPNPPCDITPNIDTLWEFGPKIFRDAADAIGSAVLRLTEYQFSDNIEGAFVRAVFIDQGLDPTGITNRDLGEIFSIRRNDLSFEIRYDTSIAQDMLDTSMGLFDIVALLAPSRGGGAFLAARGGGVITKQVLKQYLATIAKGSWKVVNESMSEAAKRYQEFISGRKWNESFILDDVKFDALKNGVLGDAKSGLRNFVDPNTGQFKPFFQGAQSLIDQAKRQTRAAQGNPIEWHFQYEEVRKATELLFNGIDDIKIILLHTPN
ncbi:Tox-REase-5 domain-containing protein [Aquimarina algiphila]|uniref:Tox-REase-5 domain-containing protein n=1 Tax=Aquimarina algiphila TaxID=2047982 RepID=UPI00232DBA66|nr:Tox-REase-5 domain-containing protein [Aquimarina algiphila]